MNINELLEIESKIDDKIKEMKIFLDEHTGADGKISAAANKTYLRMERALDGLKAEKQAFLDEAKNNQIFRDNPHLFTNPNDNSFSTNRRGVVGNEYHRNFINAFRQGFTTPVMDSLREGVLQDGGYLLPEEFDNRLVQRLTEENVLRKIGKVITTASTHKINIVATEPAATWIGEGEEITLNSPKFAQKVLGAYKLAVGTRISNELLQDSFYDLESALLEIFSRSIATAETEAFVNGAGQGKPLGLLKQMETTASSFITSKTSEITADDAIALYYTLERPYRQNAVWLASDSAVANLRRLRDANQAFLWSNSLVEGEPPTFLGAPLYTCAAMPAVSSGEVPLLFGNFRDYFVIGDRGQGRVFKPLRERFALSDETAFLMIQRCDCVLTDLRAIRGLKIK